MKTKHQLMIRMQEIVMAEAQERLAHMAGVVKFIDKNFPEQVPDHFFKQYMKDTDTALIGKLRAPDKTGRMMLDNLGFVIRHFPAE